MKANLWHLKNAKIITPELFFGCIEITKSSKCKYELDKDTGALRLDRILSTSTSYPHNYGFIPNTLSLDGDPLDVLILCSEALIPLSIVECKSIGILFMNDNGADDEKIIAVATKDPFYNCYNDISEIPKHILEEIKHFFSIYKQLEQNNDVEVEDIKSSEEAKKVIKDSIRRYNDKFN